MCWSASFAQDADIKILAINDMHSSVQNMPKLAFIVDSIRAEHPDVLLFAAGDNRTGNPINDMYTEPNLPMVEMMNAVGFNLSSMGNHECDGGIESFANTINKSYCTYLAANAQPADSLRLHFQPFKLFEHKGVRIGVIGLVQTNSTGIPDGHPDKLKGISFTTPYAAADKYAWLRKQCDVYVGLTHMGLEADTLFADAHPEFDLIVCAHSHDLVPGLVRNGVMLVQAERNLKYINEVDLKIREGKIVDRKCKTISIAHATGVSQKVKAMLDKFSDNPTLQRLIATATTPFVEKEELGCLMADGQRDIAKADISIVNAGGVRYTEKEAGDITVNDILRLDPFGNELMVAEMTGEQIVEALEQVPATDEYGPAYVSGLKYTVSMDKNKKYQVKLFTEDGKKFNLKKTYKVAANNYVCSTVPVLASVELTPLYITTSDALIKYLENKKSVSYQGVSRVTIKGVSHR